VVNSRTVLWIVAAGVVAVIAVYLFSQDRGSTPGQPAPHAIDQSP
jgi:hypothetical protein